MKKIVSFLLIALLLFSFVACNIPVTAKDFSSNGMTITLTSEFKEANIEGYTACYESKNVAVFVLKESFSLFEGAEDMSIDEYAELVRKANSSKSPSEISKSNDLVSFEYDFLNEQENQVYSYISFMYKGDDAFWLVQFACKEESYGTLIQSFIDWAKTVKFDSAN